MANIFSHVPTPRIKKSTFNLSYDVKLAFNQGNLVPIHVQEIIPGDYQNQRTNIMLRYSPLLTPLMHENDLRIYSFYVPNRILWDNWEKFIAGSETGEDTGLVVPSVNPENLTVAYNKGKCGIGSLWDYMGLPPIQESTSEIQDFDINWLPFRAVHRCWYEYFRAETFQQANLVLPKGDTVTAAEVDELLTLRNINWQKDYFTAALPWPQRGPTVNIPGISPNTDSLKIESTLTPPQFLDATGGVSPTQGSNVVWQGQGSTAGSLGQAGDSSRLFSFFPGRTGLKIEGQSDVGEDGTLDNLRTAWSLKRWLEAASRHGVRYVEHLLGHWGVRNGDSRLQRPEFLCGSTTPIIFSEVLQTSSTDSTSPQGGYAGHGMTISMQHNWKRKFTEDGFIISFAAVVPRTVYEDGVNRMYLRKDRFDYPFPEFAHISEQAIYNDEIYAPWLINAKTHKSEFGYIPRYTEFRYMPSRVAGDFRGTLDFWHQSRKFYDYVQKTGNPPSLNTTFLTSDPSTRIFAVTDEQYQTLFCQVRHSIRCTRALPKFGIPGVRC